MNPSTLLEIPKFETADSLDVLYGMLDKIQVKNGWNKPTPSLYPQPKQRFVPASWSYAQTHAALHAAGRLVGTEWAERRNLILANPIEGNDYPTVTTLVAAYQMVKGGETARSHRHTPNAMRVVIEAAPGTYTIVNGVKVPMEAGDVLLTPNWYYHGHDNTSSDEAYWVDVLDAPMVQLLGPMFFEHHPDSVETTEVVDEASPMRFAFREYTTRLACAQHIALGVRALELASRALVTFDRFAIQLDAGAVWNCPRSTANQIFIVAAGSGQSHIGDRELSWARGDVIAAPSWIPQQHEAEEGSVLIRVSDAPVMKFFDWLRSEAAVV